MRAPDPTPTLAAVLARMLAADGDRLAKRWAAASRAEASERPAAELSNKAVREPLAGLLADLARLLASHGAEAPRIFGEAARHHGKLRFEQRFTAGDVVREFHALGGLLVDEWRRRGGALDRAVTTLIGDLSAAACAGAMDDYVKQMRSSRAHIREEGAIESIVRHIAEGLLAVEADGTISFATPPVARILGVREGELAGLRPADLPQLIQRLELRVEDGRPLSADRVPWHEALATGRPSRTRWLRLRRCSDGEERIVETDAIPIYENGILRGVVATFRDRTDEQRQREALARAYEDLRKVHVKLLRRTRSQALGEVAARVSGALKNAMNTIRLRCRLASQDGVAAEHVTPIESTVDEMARLVSQLQELVAPPSGADEAVPLDEVAREALDLVRPDLVAAAEGRELRVAARLMPGVVARGSRPELREAIVHLLLEALDREPEGAGVSRGALAGATLPGVIEVVVERDDGIGRVVVGGAGRIERPIREPRGEVVGEGVEDGTRIPTPTAARSVLVIDDDDDNRAMLAAVLAAHGLRVMQAATAAETMTAAAAAAAAGEAVDAALIDLAMPDASGWDIARALRERHPGVRLALVTGYESAATSPPEGTVDAVFPKPVDLPRLFAFLGHPAPVEAHP